MTKNDIEDAFIENYHLEVDIKKVFTIFLREIKIISKDSVGQVVAHVNNGSVSKISYNNWNVK